MGGADNVSILESTARQTALHCGDLGGGGEGGVGLRHWSGISWREVIAAALLIVFDCLCACGCGCVARAASTMETELKQMLETRIDTLQDENARMREALAVRQKKTDRLTD